jgi:adenylyl-sulfate kinase
MSVYFQASIQTMNRPPPSIDTTLTNLKPVGTVVWIHGRSASGKSTLSLRVAEDWDRHTGHPCVILDGDEYRKSVSADLGFDSSSRAENIRRAALTARLLASQGFTVLVAFETPTQDLRLQARNLVSGVRFIEVALRCSLECCMRRDPKGLYLAAARKLIEGLSGVDAPFDDPETAELVINTEHCKPVAAAESVVQLLLSRGMREPIGS